jgi:hypothetical protein
MIRMTQLLLVYIASGDAGVSAASEGTLSTGMQGQEPSWPPKACADQWKRYQSSGEEYQRLAMAGRTKEALAAQERQWKAVTALQECRAQDDSRRRDEEQQAEADRRKQAEEKCADLKANAIVAHTRFVAFLNSNRPKREVLAALNEKEKSSNDFYACQGMSNPESYALRDQRTRLAEESKEEEETEQRSARARQPQYARPALSMMLCHNAKVRAGAKKEIADEMKYAREGGGIVDKQKLYELQEQLRNVDHGNREIRLVLVRKKTEPLACSSKTIMQLENCVREFASGSPSAGCNESPVGTILSIYPAVDASSFIGLSDNAPWFLER